MAVFVFAYVVLVQMVLGLLQEGCLHFEHIHNKANCTPDMHWYPSVCGWLNNSKQNFSLNILRTDELVKKRDSLLEEYVTIQLHVVCCGYVSCRGPK